MAPLAGLPTTRATPDVNRILFVKNLSYNITGPELFEVFARYGAIRQIRLGNSPKTRGTAFVVYEDVTDSKTAYEKLNGYHLHDRYLVILYHQVSKQNAKADLARREAELAELKKAHNIEDEA